MPLLDLKCQRVLAAPFMALFGLERLPHRSTISRFLAALCQAPVEAWHAASLPAKPKSPDAGMGVTLRERLQSAGPDRVQ